MANGLHLLQHNRQFAEPAFSLTEEEMEAMLASSVYIDCCPEQVDIFLTEVESLPAGAISSKTDIKL